MTTRARRRSRPAATVAALAVAGLLAGALAGCGAGSGPDDARATGSAAATDGAGGGPGGVAGLASAIARASSTAPGSSDPATPGPAASTPAASIPAASIPAASTPPATPVRTVPVGELLFFETPSKNIACQVDTTQVRCDIATHDWQTPARPAACDLDYGNGVYLADGWADYVCAGDTVLHASGAMTLVYGESVTAGDFTCTSNTGGVTCRNSSTGRGFSLSRQVFGPF